VASATERQTRGSHHELITFMEQKCQVLETLKPSTNVANVDEAHVGNDSKGHHRILTFFWP